MSLFGPNIRKMQASLDIDGLTEVLTNNQSIKIRQTAAEALGQTALLSAVKPLVKAMHDPSEAIRATVVTSLGIIGANLLHEQWGAVPITPASKANALSLGINNNNEAYKKRDIFFKENAETALDKINEILDQALQDESDLVQKGAQLAKVRMSQVNFLIMTNYGKKHY